MKKFLFFILFCLFFANSNIAANGNYFNQGDTSYLSEKNTNISGNILVEVRLSYKKNPLNNIGKKHNIRLVGEYNKILEMQDMICFPGYLSNEDTACSNEPSTLTIPMLFNKQEHNKVQLEKLFNTTVNQIYLFDKVVALGTIHINHDDDMFFVSNWDKSVKVFLGKSKNRRGQEIFVEIVIQRFDNVN